ncbi:MAG: Trm112 family protein [Pseudomonadota bacterium]
MTVAAETDPKMLELLVCPITKGPLKLSADEQYLCSDSAGIAYPIRDGVPILVQSESVPLDDDLMKSR